MTQWSHLAAQGVLDVGVVGLGTAARTHLAVLAERSDVKVTFAVDPDPHQSARPVDPEPQRYTDIDEALEKHEPALVVIATPTPTHVELARRALTRSDARLLVEKPLAPGASALAELRALGPTISLVDRLFVAHHFAFAPEVLWAAAQVAEHPEWGPPTRITAAFYDPYVTWSDQALASYTSSWADSGVNQLSLLARFVDIVSLDSFERFDAGTSSWATATFRAGATTGAARLLTSWQAADSSKRMTIELGDSGVEVWLDLTAMTGFVAQGGRLLSRLGNDGCTPRKIAHYRPLYESLLSDTPDPILGFDAASKVVELLG